MHQTRERTPRISSLTYLAGFGFSVLCVLTAAWAHPKVNANFQDFRRTSEIYVNIRRLLSVMQDAETGQRGFLLTGRDAYLKPYEAANASLEKVYTDLEASILDQIQKERLAQLRVLIRSKNAELAASIEERRKNGLESALQIVFSDEGRRTMDEIRDLVAAAEARERSLIEQSVLTGDFYSRVSMGAMVAAGISLITMGLIIVRRFRRDDRERSELLARAEAHVQDLSVANTALNRANEELQHFAYVASHDLQEPLRSISGYVQLLGRRYEDQLDEKARGYIQRSQAAAQRMQRLIEDLLAYTRISTQGKPFATVQTAKVVQDAIENLDAAIHEAQGKIHFQNLPDLHGDRVQLYQLFQNLLSNGLKFRGEKPVEIQIFATREHDDAGSIRKSPFWLFMVRDNGIGIAPEYQPRLFKIFQRLHTRQEFEGTGVGLALCKRIVERHGGRIWLESAPGVGTTFYFTLPAVHEPNP